MAYNLIFIDESESMRRAVSMMFHDNPDFNVNLINEPSLLHKAVKNFFPDIIVLSYNTIDTELKKSITGIKTSASFSGIPLILLVPSDLSDNEKDTLIKLNADGFIYRPFGKESFISKIKKVLEATGVSGIENNREEEKIYDISLFESEKPAVAAATDSSSGGSKAQDAQEPAETPEAPEQAEQSGNAAMPKISGNPPAPSMSSIYEESASVVEVPSNAVYAEENRSESPEINRAFENLFKDDAIFKEFQDLNETEYPEDTEDAKTAEAGGVTEETGVTAAEETGGTAAEDLSLKTVDAPKTIELDGTAASSHLPEYLPDDIFKNSNSKEEKNLKILDEGNLVKFDDYLKNSIEKTLEEIKPLIIENIKQLMPEIIERLVKEEIEKIKMQ